jgi:hypothetical protein
VSGPYEGARVVVAIFDDRVDVFIRPDLTPQDAAAERRAVADRLERDATDEGAEQRPDE